MRRGTTRASTVLVALALLGGCATDNASRAAVGTPAAAHVLPLVGLFRVGAGTCTTNRATGSYFRMVRPGGTLNLGPYVANSGSPCPDPTWSPLAPGTDGGLRTDRPQPEDALLAPVAWGTTRLAVLTRVPPRLVARGPRLDGDIGGYVAAFGTELVAQGAPVAPEGRGDLTAGPKGLFDAATRAYAVEWSSTIADGSLAGATGIWHLEGTFEPTGGPSGPR